MLNKVLIVEDSSLQAKMYKNVFCVYPECKLVFAANGVEAFDRLAIENGFDLIVLDINMPKMNGITFLQQKKDGEFSKIPVIVISTEGKDDDIRRALELGARAYVKKPWAPDQIRQLVGKIFQV